MERPTYSWNSSITSLEEVSIRFWCLQEDPRRFLELFLFLELQAFGGTSLDPPVEPPDRGVFILLFFRGRPGSLQFISTQRPQRLHGFTLPEIIMEVETSCFRSGLPGWTTLHC